MDAFRFAIPQSKISSVVACALAMALAVIFLADRGSGQNASPSSTVSDSAAIQGTVRNAHGAPVVAAKVQLHFKDEAQVLTAHTDDKGSYRFSALHEGDYTLRAQMQGFDDAVGEVVGLRLNETKTVDLKLAAAKDNGSSTAAPEFFDEPHFSVAGVTDATNFGGHGSDLVVRTRNALSKDTSSLGADPKRASPAEIASYENEKSKIQALLAKSDNAELHHSLADIDEKLANSVEAAHEYQRAAEINPSETNVFDWGSELLLHHAPEPAQEVFEKGNRLFPQSVRMLLGLGAAAYARGSSDEAVRRFCQASDLQPENPTPYLFLGRLLKTEMRPSPELVQTLARFVKLHPDDAMANYYYAIGIWKMRASPEDAQARGQVETLLKNAMRIDPKLSDAHLQLGIIDSEQKKLPQAIAEYEQAIQSDPRSESAHYRLAQAYRQNGNPDKAKAELNIYDQLVKDSAEKNESERHEIQQFIYTLRDQPATAPN
jgi:tetratricopeptide (TPR) repeat protein